MHQGLEDMKLIVPYCHVLSGVLTNRTQRLTVLILPTIHIPTLPDSFILALVLPGVCIASHNCILFPFASTCTMITPLVVLVFFLPTSYG